MKDDREQESCLMNISVNINNTWKNFNEIVEARDNAVMEKRVLFVTVWITTTHRYNATNVFKLVLLYTHHTLFFIAWSCLTAFE